MLSQHCFGCCVLLSYIVKGKYQPERRRKSFWGRTVTVLSDYEEGRTVSFATSPSVSKTEQLKCTLSWDDLIEFSVEVDHTSPDSGHPTFFDVIIFQIKRLCVVITVLFSNCYIANPKVCCRLKLDSHRPKVKCTLQTSRQVGTTDKGRGVNKSQNFDAITHWWKPSNKRTRSHKIYFCYIFRRRPGYLLRARRRWRPFVARPLPLPSPLWCCQ